MTYLYPLNPSCMTESLAWLGQANGVGEALKQPSVQAAIIAASIGLFVFAGTQWVLHCRERTSLLLSKLEMLYKTTSSLANLSVNRLDYYAGPQSHEGLLKARGTDLTDQIAMLQAFHFPPLAARVNSLMQLNGKALLLLAGPFRAADKQTIRKALTELDVSVTETLGLMCKNKSSYTKGRWYYYIPIVRSFFR